MIILFVKTSIENKNSSDNRKDEQQFFLQFWKQKKLQPFAVVKHGLFCFGEKKILRSTKTKNLLARFFSEYFFCFELPKPLHLWPWLMKIHLRTPPSSSLRHSIFLFLLFFSLHFLYFSSLFLFSLYLYFIRLYISSLTLFTLSIYCIRLYISLFFYSFFLHVLSDFLFLFCFYISSVYLFWCMLIFLPCFFFIRFH